MLLFPDPLYCSATELYNEIGYKYCRAVVSASGHISWVFGGNIAVTCSVVLTYFPFDTQKCAIMLQNWAYDDNAVNLLYHPEHYISGISTPEWDLYDRRPFFTNTNFTADIYTNHYRTVHFEFGLRRKSLYYMNTLVLPCVAMTSLNLFVFWLPPDSGEKVSLGNNKCQYTSNR